MKKLLENKKLLAICSASALAIVVLCATLIFQLAIRPGQLYQEATEQFAAENYVAAYDLLKRIPESKNDVAELLPYYAAYSAYAEGDYHSAAESFEALGSYREECPKMAAYCSAMAQFSDKNYEAAYNTFSALGTFLDSSDMAPECHYRLALALMAEKDYEGAAEYFSALENYKDSPTQVLECSYQTAMTLLEQKDYGAAYNAFATLKDYSNSREMRSECRYRMGNDLMAAGDFAGALERFSALENYKDSADRGKECSYQLAVQTLDAGAYEDAYTAFAALGEYKDARDMLSECRYRMAGSLMAQGDYAGALERYNALVGYKDSDTQAKECRYQQAAALAAEQTVEAMTQAAEMYTQIGDYKDAAAQVTALEAAIEEAKRVPYSPSSEAYFDVYATNPTNLWVKPYKFAVQSSNNKDRCKVFKLPSAVSAAYSMVVGDVNGSKLDAYNCNIESRSISNNSFQYGSRYTVTGDWESGEGYTWSNNSNKTYLSAVRWGNTAIILYGLSGDDSAHSSFYSRVRLAKVEEDFSGMVGGAIRFGEYEYIDLGNFYFKSVHRPQPYEPGNRVTLITKGGVKITVNNSCTGGEITETYNGIDIYTYDNSEAYIHIKPDVYIDCKAGNAASARQILRQLIDNYHCP